MANAWAVTTPQIGFQAITAFGTTQNHPLGTRVTATSATFGMGEFIYLLGVANTAIGSLAFWDATTFQTTLVPTSSNANLNCPLAVAMSANVASNYGWYQVAGMATVLKDAVKFSPGPLKLYISSTNAGRVKSVASNGLQVWGARSANTATVTSTTSTIVVHIERVFAEGQVT